MALAISVRIIVDNEMFAELPLAQLVGGDVVVEVHREDGHFCVQHTDGIEGVHAHFFDDGTFEKLLTNAHSHQG